MAAEAKIIVKIDDAAARRKTDQAEREEKRREDDQGRGGGGGRGQGRGGSGGQGRGGGGVAVVPTGKKALKGLVNIVALAAARRVFEIQVGFIRRAAEGKGPIAEGIAEAGAFLPEKLAKLIAKAETLIQTLASLTGSGADFARGQVLLGGKLDSKELGKFLKEQAQLTALAIAVEKLKASFGREALGAAGADAAEEFKNMLLGSGSHG